MTFEEFYGASYDKMLLAERQLVRLAETYPHPDEENMNPVIYCRSRLKTPESMVNKLRMRSLPEDGQTALSEVYDAVGVRIVCAFIEDVYSMVQWLKSCAELEVIREKDYMASPKENGYRSYHLLVKIIDGDGAGIRAEIQVRTIAIDSWATLEHRLKYKKDLDHAELMYIELRRCADEIASVDLSMQTLREFVKAGVI